MDFLSFFNLPLVCFLFSCKPISCLSNWDKSFTAWAAAAWTSYNWSEQALDKNAGTTNLICLLSFLIMLFQQFEVFDVTPVLFHLFIQLYSVLTL